MNDRNLLNNLSRFRISLGRLFLLSNLVMGILGFSYLHWQERQNQIQIWVPKRDLPAYTRIQPKDLTERSISARQISSEIVQGRSDILDRYTVVEISKDRPINRKQLGPELTATQKNLLQNTVLIGIPATSAMVLGGNIQAGDSVDTEFVQNATDKQPSPKTTQFKDVFVFDIKPNLANASVTTSVVNQPSEWVVVLAVPTDLQEDFSRSIGSGKAFLFRKF